MYGLNGLGKYFQNRFKFRDGDSKISAAAKNSEPIRQFWVGAMKRTEFQLPVGLEGSIKILNKNFM